MATGASQHGAGSSALHAAHAGQASSRSHSGHPVAQPADNSTKPHPQPALHSPAQVPPSALTAVGLGQLLLNLGNARLDLVLVCLGRAPVEGQG